MKTLLAACLSLALTTAVAAPSPVGAFAVVEPLEQKSVGTVFLIDADYGWFLTACHVLPVAYPDGEKRIAMQWRYADGTSAVRSKLMKLVPVATGFDYTKPEELRTLKNTTRDWALLQIVNADDRELMPLNREFRMMRDLKGETLQALSGAVNSAVQIYGIPVGDVEIRPDRGTVGPGAVATGLWNVSVPSVAGNSGGPVGLLGDDSVASLLSVQKAGGLSIPLLGLMVKQADLSSGHSEMLPTFAFIQECAAKAPKTEKVKQFLNYLDAPDTVADWDIRAELLLRRMNAIEHWQLIGSLCALAEQRPKRIADFILKNYSNERFQLGFNRLFSCNRRLVLAMQEATNEAVGTQKRGGNNALTPSTVAVISDLRDWVVANRELVAAEDAPATSTFLSNSVYISERFYGFPETPAASRAALLAAYTLDKNNPDLPVATAVTIKELNPEDKVLLAGSAITVTGGRSPASNPDTPVREFVLNSEDGRFFYSRIAGRPLAETASNEVWAGLAEKSKNLSETRRAELLRATIGQPMHAAPH